MTTQKDLLIAQAEALEALEALFQQYDDFPNHEVPWQACALTWATDLRTQAASQPPSQDGGAQAVFAYCLARDGRAVMGEQCIAEDSGCLTEAAEYEECEVVPVYLHAASDSEARALLREARKLLVFVNYRPDTPALVEIDAFLSQAASLPTSQPEQREGDVRAEFEAWARTVPDFSNLHRDSDGHYQMYAVACAWIGFKAARQSVAQRIRALKK